MTTIKKILLILLFIPCFLSKTSGQSDYVLVKPVTPDSTEDLDAVAGHYIDLRVSRLKKQVDQQDRQLRKALKKFIRKEKALRARTDMRKGFDSLQNEYREKMDQGRKGKAYTTARKTLDTLKAVQSFARTTLGKASPYSADAEEWNKTLAKYDLNSIEARLDYQEQMNHWISDYGSRLEQELRISGNTDAVKQLGKTLFYYKQRWACYKSLLEEPEKGEAKILEYLRGVPGFEESLSQSVQRSASQNGVVSSRGLNADQLQKMGFQTRQSVRQRLDQKFDIQNNEQAQAFRNKMNEAKETLAEAQNLKNKTKKSLEELRTQGFRPNPLKGMPLSQRLEKQFLWRMNKAGNGLPAMLSLQGQLGFQHTERLTYNLTGGLAIGLGQNLRNLRLTFEGLQAGGNIDWKWIWGLSSQAGYEANFKEYRIQYLEQTNDRIPPQLISRNRWLKHTAYAGIMKTYRINQKYQGTILIAYDFLWNQYNKQSPLIFKFGWKK